MAGCLRYLLHENVFPKDYFELKSNASKGFNYEFSRSFKQNLYTDKIRSWYPTESEAKKAYGLLLSDRKKCKKQLANPIAEKPKNKPPNEEDLAEYDNANSFSEGLALVMKKVQYGFIDTTGNAVIPLQYDYTGDFSKGLAFVKRKDNWGFIDKTRKEVIPLTYERVDKFSGGLAAAMLNGKYGYIDKTGNVKVPLQYEDRGYFLRKQS